MTAAGFRKALAYAAEQATRLSSDGTAPSPAMQTAIFVGALEGILGFEEPEVAARLHAVGRPVSVFAATPAAK